jgi:hypothetical protein
MMYVNELLEGQPHISSKVTVIARIYANLQGLANTCHNAGIVPSLEHTFEFARGFTSGQVLFDFIDVGPGKERMDDKISGK